MGQKQNKRVENVDIIISSNNNEVSDQPTIKLEDFGIPKYVKVINMEDLQLISTVGSGGSCAVTYKAMLMNNKSLCAVRIIRFREKNFRLWFPRREVYSLENKILLKPLGILFKPPRIGLVEDYIDGWDIWRFMRRHERDEDSITLFEKLCLIYELAVILKFFEDHFPSFLSTFLLNHSLLFVENIEENQEVEDEGEKEEDDEDINIKCKYESHKRRFRLRLKHVSMEMKDDYEKRLHNNEPHPGRCDPPEVGNGKPLTIKSPVFSFAIIAYEIFTGKDIYREYEAEYEHDEILFNSHTGRSSPVFLVHSRGVRPALLDFQKGEYSWFCRLIQKCWAQKMEDRPSFNFIIKEFGRHIGFGKEFVQNERDRKERREFLKVFCSEVDVKSILTVKLLEGRTINFVMKHILLM